MAGSDVVIVKTGCANIAAVVAAFERIGADVRITVEAADVASAERLVLPGVGSFGPVMEVLRANGLAEAIRARVLQSRPALGICLGLQVLAQSSEEGRGASGLGILPVTVRRFDDSVVVPQLGWNRVEPEDQCSLLRPGEAYFANSYRIDQAPAGWSTAWTEHGAPFVSAVERGGVLGCQFHPELSGAWGRSLLERWMEVSAC